MRSRPKASDILRRSYKILALAGLFFFLTLGLVARLWWQSSHSKGFGTVSLRADGYAPASIHVDKPSVFVTGPEPAKLRAFSWPLKKDIVIEGECHDQYYTVLIYPEGRDYRQDPTTNVYNRAYDCTKGEQWQQILTSNTQLQASNLQLATGTYYLIRADQGAEGSWYNPY